VAQAPRSYLYVPGDRPDRMASAAGRGADALILDLEDAVPTPAKAGAREQVRTFLAEAPEGPQWWVRINAESVAEDIAAVVGPRLSGIVLPKAEPALLAELDRALSSAEAESGVAPRSVPVLALIETAHGLVVAEQLATARDVLDRLAAAQEQAAGVALTADGRFIDEAVARGAREVVGRAR
jgi:citrate lyase subunit beta/citryl-CoA lyase